MSLSVVAGAAGLYAWATTGAERPGAEGYVLVQVGEDDLSTTARNMANAGLLRTPWLFVLYAAALEPWRSVQPGEHLLPQGNVAPRTLLHLLARSGSRPTVRVLIPEGYDSFEIGARMEQAGVCTAASFVGATTDGRTSESLEGYLYPATYEFHQDESPSRVVTKMQDEGRRRFRDLFATRTKELALLQSSHGLGPPEVVTLASIVQREAARVEEFGPIAAVFLNRLTNPSFKPSRMLQSDPTAAYGCKRAPTLPSCKEYRGRVLPVMLRDSNNPYNTYRHPGLPPGPISNPGSAAVEAVLQAPPTRFLFFVADGHGRHVFSETLADHNRAIRQLQRK